MWRLASVFWLPPFGPVPHDARAFLRVLWRLEAARYCGSR